MTKHRLIPTGATELQFPAVHPAAALAPGGLQEGSIPAGRLGGRLRGAASISWGLRGAQRMRRDLPRAGTGPAHPPGQRAPGAAQQGWPTSRADLGSLWLCNHPVPVPPEKGNEELRPPFPTLFLIPAPRCFLAHGMTELSPKQADEDTIPCF